MSTSVVAPLHTRRRLRQITRSAWRVTTDRSWLTSRRLKRESRWTLDRKSQNCSSPATSTPETGSSSSRMSGASRSARANSTRWSSPPESRPRGLWSRWATPARSRLCRASSRVRREAPRKMGRRWAESAKKSSTVIGTSGSRGRRCGTYPMRGAPWPCSAARQKRIFPVYGTWPRIARSRVVFPAPLGPTRAVTSPHRRSASIPERISTPPFRTVRLRISSVWRCSLTVIGPTAPP